MTSGCGKEDGSSKDNEEDITIQELADQVMEEVPTETEKEPTETIAEVPEQTTEEVEEEFTLPEPMPEILNASLDDCKVQVNDMLFDISFWYLPGVTILEEQEVACLKEQKMGSFKELYEQVKSWGFVTGKEITMDRLVVDQTYDSIYFGPSENPRESVVIVYYNFSGETKALEDCDAYILFCALYNSDRARAISPYVYVAGGINSEDSYWDYNTLIEYLKKNGIEYEEGSYSDEIHVTVTQTEAIECYRKDGNILKDFKYVFVIDADTTDLKYVFVQSGTLG